jgi:16S rRNA (cytosine1402-N4)-methyltransferase
VTAAHVPVLREAVLAALAPRPGAVVVDATVGLGGHAEAILEQLAPSGRLIGLDRDAELLAVAAARLARFGSSARLVHSPFSRLRQVLDAEGIEQVDGVLLDLGVASPHLDDAARGFSFRARAADAPLDMRLDRSRGETAAEWLARASEEELVDALRAGDVPAARRVAAALLARRPLATCGQLADAVAPLALPRRRHHPATLVFQALRMVVNDEAAELDAALEQAVDALAPGGRIAVLSYHSGEDRRVKQFFVREARGCICPPSLPRCGCGRLPRLKRVAWGERAADEEVRANPRARSARLRAGERL